MLLQSVKIWQKSIKEIDLNNSFEHESKVISQNLYEVYAAQTLPDRVLALESLVNMCEFVIEGIDNTELDYRANFLVKTMKLQAEAMSLLKNILDVRSNEELEIKLQENREYVRQNKGIAVQNFSFPVEDSDLKKIGSDYVDENIKHKVRYLTEIEREEQRVIVSDGRFKKIVRGEGDFYNQTLSIQPFSTKSLNSVFEPGQSTIVVDEIGNMFAGVTMPRYYHHSSAVAGKPVYFAGLITTNENGELKEIGNQSGHYKPSMQNTINFLKLLGKKGALDACIDISIISDRAQSLAKLEHNIHITNIQHELLKSAVPESKLTSYNQWRKASNGGVFYKRYSTVKDIDQSLLLYFKTFSISRPEENAALISRILKKIDNEEKIHPNSRRKQAISDLKKQLTSEKMLWDSQVNLTKTSINPRANR